MRKNNLEKLDLELYEETLQNGLKVFIVPKENVNGIYATLSAKFGSIHTEFALNGSDKMIKVPMGVAHFLEHKMFEQKDGVDPFTYFSERGCDANANTSNYKTTYLFSGANSFAENITYLLDYVQSPYFTDENVEKEKGIIEQEINMYSDEPFFKIYDGIIYNTFINHPIKYSIAGNVEDVYKITKEDLYNCYNTFYHPSNMFLVITGNIDPKETINIIKLNQENKKFDEIEEIQIKEYDEPNHVEKEFEEIKMDIELPKLGIGYKINCTNIHKNIYDIKTYLSILLDLKLGSTSTLSEKLKNQNLITHDIDITLINSDKHILAMLIAETEKPDQVLELIDSELKDLHISEEELERKKKVRKSNCIYRSDSIYSINNKIMGDIITRDKIILDDYKEIDNLNIRMMEKIIRNINLNNKTIYKINKS